MRTNKPKSNNWHSLSALALISLFVFISSTAHSDDIDVYYHEPFDPVPPNILFVLDESGSMEWGNEICSYPGSPNRRRDLLVDALKEVFNNDEMSNVNAALMGYAGVDEDEQGFRAYSGAFKVISEGNNKSDFLEQIDKLGADGSTPTVRALHYAVEWFKPGDPFFRYNYTNYDSPLVAEDVVAEKMRCAPNHIVLLSDGAPNGNSFTDYNGVKCDTSNLLFKQGINNNIDCDTWNNADNEEEEEEEEEEEDEEEDEDEEEEEVVKYDDTCANEIATYANNIDLMTGPEWDGIQNITIDTIGFHASGDTRLFLERVAHAGGGAYYDADEITLAKDLIEIVANAQRSINYAYNSPAIPFNVNNTAVSGDVIYVPLFQPESTKFWRGNLKKYSVNVTSEGELVLKGLDNEDVLDEQQKFQSTRDLFCDNDTCILDRGDPLVGGAAHDMTGTRKLYTYLGSELDLSNDANRVSNSNDDITADMLDVATAMARTELLNWITRDPDYEATEKNPSHIGVMGAPIHTQPIVVTYSSDKQVVLIPTSEGVLEAIDAKTGKELWAFMPKDLLPGIRTLKNNDDSTIPYYGLDGPMTYYEIGPDENKQKMVIFGMRRGGRKYHIIDVTNQDAPRYVAEISSVANFTDFEKLGQTWSKPIFVKMKIDGAEQEVLVFGGGYDPDQDNATSTVGYSDDEGNIIYIVKASDGSLLKSISNSGADINISNMTFAIPSDLATVDLNGSGVVERLYASDVGGQIIRIDINEEDGTITGGVIADINAGASAHRKFFTTPQIGYYNRAGTQFLAILIGTGDITDPLSVDVTDRFYMIKEPAIWNLPDWDTYDVADDGDFQDASDTRVSALTAGKRGWYLDYSGSEKSFSKAILYDYSIFFTTYSAKIVGPKSLCEVVTTTGTAKLYGLDLLTADAVFNWDGSTEGEVTPNDRFKELELQGIPPSPALVFPAGGKDGDGNALIGKTVYLYADLKKQAAWSDRFRPIYWEEVINE